MEVEFLNLKKAYMELKPELDKLWYDINKESYYVLGPRLEKFEQEFADYLGVKHVIGVANGLDALTLSLRALDIGINDEVMVPSHTYIASWLAISKVGAKPVPIEVNLNTYLLASDKIESAITEKTKAIMPVHLYGHVCDMTSIMAIANKYKLKVIEDAAQAHGAIDINNKKAGSFGHANGFSFYPGKNLGCFGDGGCISTNDKTLAQKIKLLRNYGSKIRYEHEIVGINSRLDDLQAGILSIKLKYLDEWNQRRKKIAEIYLQELQNIQDLILPEFNHGYVWHIFPVRTKKRHELKEFLMKNGIGINVHYPKAVHLQHAYKNLGLKTGVLPIAEKIGAEVLSLPIGPHLSEEEVRYCVKVLKKWCL